MRRDMGEGELLQSCGLKWRKWYSNINTKLIKIKEIKTVKTKKNVNIIVSITTKKTCFLLLLL